MPWMLSILSFSQTAPAFVMLLCLNFVILLLCYLVDMLLCYFVLNAFNLIFPLFLKMNLALLLCYFIPLFFCYFIPIPLLLSSSILLLFCWEFWAGMCAAVIVPPSPFPLPSFPVSFASAVMQYIAPAEPLCPLQKQKVKEWMWGEEPWTCSYIILAFQTIPNLRKICTNLNESWESVACQNGLINY